MNIKRARATYIPQEPGMQGIWEKIERGGRICYQSDGEIMYDKLGRSLTAEPFARKLLNVYKHLSVAEHAGVYFVFPIFNTCDCNGKTRKSYGPKNIFVPFFTKRNISKYCKFHFVDDCHSDTKQVICYLSTNYRVIVENGLEALMSHSCEPTSSHDRVISIRVITDRGVSAELNRHRRNSPSERSTRYAASSCRGLSIVCPEFITDEEINRAMKDWEIRSAPAEPIVGLCRAISNGEVLQPIDLYLFANYASEYSYTSLRDFHWSRQEARRVLPLDLETELLISAHESDWKHFFDLRLKGTTGAPHPDMKALTKRMAEELVPVMPWLNSYI